MQFSTFGFSGSRSLSGSQFLLCSQLAAQVSAAGGMVATGCAHGADAAARQGSGSQAVIFTSSSSKPYALVNRSVQFIQFLAGSPHPVLVSFPNCLCPAGLLPSPFKSKCFAGFGSGSWASLALASGLGVPLLVYLPSNLVPPTLWGNWSHLQSSVFNGFWHLPSKQLSLF